MFGYLDILEIVGATLATIGAVLNARGLISGFYVWIASNLILVTINFVTHHYPQALLFVVYCGTSSYGIYQWGKHDTRP